jgi:D-inositol-3-phosphate glycosyltransferase
MNVYVRELATALTHVGWEVDIYTRTTSSEQPSVTQPAPGVKVISVESGPFEGLRKEELPGQLCGFIAEVLRHGAALPRGYYDVLHTHYWLSGQVGWLAAERWGIPLIHTMHTMARVKNASLAPGDAPEPLGRILGEEQVVAEANALIASTGDEARALIRDYHADPGRIHTIPPGVDLDVFRPGGSGFIYRDDGAADADPFADAFPRVSAASDPSMHLVVFAGRVQLLKGPDTLIRALAHLPSNIHVVVLGGASGRPTAVRELHALAHLQGVADRVHIHPPVPAAQLAAWFRRADVVAVPSHSESFGLVAAEAQACGTPVVATAVGGLASIVVDGVTGRLVAGHDENAWADALNSILSDATTRERYAQGAAEARMRFGWDATAAATAEVYRELLAAGAA